MIVRSVLGSVALLLALVLLPLPVAAETIDDAYHQALEHYYAERLSEAVEGFERVAAVPTRHEDLFYNLGCAYFRLGKLGPAIYNFKRSLALDPDRDDARFNLQTARALVATRGSKDVLKGVPNESWWVGLVRVLSLRSWTIVFVVLWWLVFGALLALRRVGSGPVRAGLIAGTALVGLLTLVCGVLLAGRLYLARRTTMGIILPDRIAVHEGPSSATRKLFKLHAGLEVTMAASSGESGWVRIRLANGLEGWIERRDLGLL